MTNEFTAWCNYYYQVSILFAEVEEHFKNLVKNTPLYCGQTRLNEVDVIIDYNRAAQDELARLHKMREDMKEAEIAIRGIMRHFEILPGTVLTGEIPGEMAYEVWADEQDGIHISKTGDLEPEEDDANIIVIELSGAGVL